MMFRALVSDLLEIEGVEVIATRDARLGLPNLPINIRVLHDLDEFFLAWIECLESVDAVWPIAPEYSHVLKHISETVISQGKLLLNSSPQAVHKTTSKLLTAKHLIENRIPVVPTYRFEDGIPDQPGSWVLKPDDGVGCQGVRICRDRDDLCRQFENLPMHRDYVIQPFIHGIPTSINMLAYNGEAIVLSINHQRIAMTDDRIVLLGCVVNGHRENKALYHKLGREVGATFPDLWGIVGVDIIDTGNGLKVLEVNPRVTTSYVGLKESIGVNPAAMVLDLLKGRLPMRDQILKSIMVDVNLEFAGAA